MKQNQNQMLLRVDDSAKIHEFDRPFVPGSTVLDLLRSSGLKHELIEHPEMGMLVKSIDGAENEGVKGFNWSYSVNLYRPACSCCKLVLEPGDVVEFRYELYGDDEERRVANGSRVVSSLGLIVRAAMEGGLTGERAEAAYEEVMGGLRFVSGPLLESLVSDLKTTLGNEKRDEPGTVSTAA